MTQEEIRKTWQEAATRFYQPSPDELETIYRRKKETALEKLAKKYKRFSILGATMVIVSACYLLPNSIIPHHMKIRVALAFMIYFAICGVMDGWLYKGITSINCLTMTVKEVAEKAMHYRKIHLIFIAITFPLAVGVVGSLLYAAGFDIYLTMGVVSGAVIGLIIGYRNYLEFMAEYRKLSE